MNELEKERTTAANNLKQDSITFSEVYVAGKVQEVVKLDEEEIIAKFTKEASAEQKEIFSLIDNWVRKENCELRSNPKYKRSQIFKFITGGAGVGKTYLIKALMAIFEVYSVPYQSLAYTGVASRIANGNTIHNFFQLSFKLKCNLDPYSKQARLVRNCEVIIIDEVSMLPASIFRVVQQILRSYENPRCDYKLPFGGRSVILAGDPAQLPVIQGNGIWYDTLFYDYFDVYNLTEIQRTRDRQFHGVLKTIRQGVVDKSVHEFLKERVIQCSLEDLPKMVTNDGVFLCAKRNEKDIYNEIVLRSIEGPYSEYRANDYDRNHVPLTVAKILVLVNASKTLLPTNLKLKVGCKVVVLKNLDTLNGWVNGTFAKVVSLRSDYIIVHDIQNQEKRKIIERYEEDISPMGKEGTAFRNQFPLDLAYGLTVHKSQGLSLPEVYINMDCAWESGQMYVAISRCQYPDKLRIINYNVNTIFIKPFFRQLLQWISQTSLLIEINKKLIAQAIHPRELEENKRPLEKRKTQKAHDHRKKIFNSLFSKS